MTYSTQTKKGEELNRPYHHDLSIHEWYRFVLSYPPHLVRHYLDLFDLPKNAVVLDPFCGTGTTLVECKKLGISSIGLEANPVVHFAATVKTSWNVDPDALAQHALTISETTINDFRKENISDSPLLNERLNGQILRKLGQEQENLLIKNSISPLPLHKVLILKEKIQLLADSRFVGYERLALAKELVFSISNLKFGPEVGVGKEKHDAAVVANWKCSIDSMVDDLRSVSDSNSTLATVHLADSRDLSCFLYKPNSVDAVITSPPYPNEKDYSRTTRLESVVLDFISSKAELRKHKKSFLRSNTRGVYKADTDHEWIAKNKTVLNLASEIETKRLDLKKTSGFEKSYHRVVLQYFGGIARHLNELKKILKPGAKLAYVVGDQASYLQIMIRTGKIIGEIAEECGYELVGIDLFRNRISTATKQKLREEVVLLKWNGQM